MKRVINLIKRLFYSIIGLDNKMIVISTRERYRLLHQISSQTGITNEKNTNCNVIVSMTSYGNKLYQCYLAVESMLHQTMKPNRIILWLDETKYNDRTLLPLALQEQEKRGLEIRLCKDVRSHTKLVPALQSFPDDVIITIDDDIIYPIDFVERLIKEYNQDPTKIYFYRGHYMLTDANSRPGPYLDWVRKGAVDESIYNFPTGVGGILYPPHCLHPDVTKDEIFLKLCPTADDVWFKIMSYLNNVICKKIKVPHYEEHFVPIDIEEETSLQRTNVTNGANDRQIESLFKYYNIKNK